MSGANNPQQSGSSSAEREQKMLDSSMENLSRRLSDLRNSLTSLVYKIENDPNLNWPSFLNSLALTSGQMNSLMKMIKNEATNKQPPLLYKRYVTLPLFLSPDRDEELAKMTEGRVTTFVSFKLCNFYLLYPHPFNGIYSHMMLFLIYYAPNLIQKLRLDMQVMKTEIIVWHQIL